MKQTLIWTALPNGIREGVARLSLMLSPRLEGSGTDPDGKTLLTDFPDFVNWPSNREKHSICRSRWWSSRACRTQTGFQFERITLDVDLYCRCLRFGSQVH